jgi:hypothetical protein
MDKTARLLNTHGPTRSSQLAEWLQSEFGISTEAARKQLSRARSPVRSFPFSLLPKREAFFYLEGERGSERYWFNFLKALRETETVYAAAIDGVRARGGAVCVDEFPVVSGAPNQQQKHVPSSLVLSRLCESGFLRTINYAEFGDLVTLAVPDLGHVDFAGIRAREMVEGVMLDGVREWARKNGLASYNTIAIRGENHPRLVGPYKWDLTGPSYLLPLRERVAAQQTHGFLVADAFAGVSLDENQVRYFVKKATGLRSTKKVGRVLPIIIAAGFTSEALTSGHRAGIVLATPDSLFGSHVARGLNDLLSTLTRSAEMVSGNPAKLASLIENLSEIEGAAGNLRGVMFELLVAYLVRQDGSIDMGRIARDAETGKIAEIDILSVTKGNCVAYECKGKSPGGTVSLAEVEEWLRRLPTFRSHIRAQQNLSEVEIRFELWTSGKFDPDAIAKLEQQKRFRTNAPIDWKDGKAVRDVSRGMKESRVTMAFDEHFFKHPLAY